MRNQQSEAMDRTAQLRNTFTQFVQINEKEFDCLGKYGTVLPPDKVP